MPIKYVCPLTSSVLHTSRCYATHCIYLDNWYTSYEKIKNLSNAVPNGTCPFFLHYTVRTSEHIRWPIYSHLALRRHTECTIKWLQGWVQKWKSGFVWSFAFGRWRRPRQDSLGQMGDFQDTNQSEQRHMSTKGKLDNITRGSSGDRHLWGKGKLTTYQLHKSSETVLQQRKQNHIIRALAVRKTCSTKKNKNSFHPRKTKSFRFRLCRWNLRTYLLQFRFTYTCRLISFNYLYFL